MFYNKYIMERSARAEALNLIRSGDPITVPETPDNLTPDTPEALSFIDSFKPEHFASLALVIDAMFDHVIERKQSGLYSQIEDYSSWRSLANNWRQYFLGAADSVEYTDIYRNADAFALKTGTFNTRRHIALSTKMNGGIGTGIITTLTLLRNIPHISKHHAEQGEDIGFGDVARHPQSVSLLRRLAKLSINQAMAAQTALEGADQASSWSDIDHVLEPEHFVLHRYPDGSKSLGYADFANLNVPAGYTPHEPIPKLTEQTRVTDVPSEQAATIGCPVTLLQGRLSEMWDWGIDLVEANQLWDENWPQADSNAA